MERFDESKPIKFIYEYDGKVVTRDEAIEILKTQKQKQEKEETYK